MDKQTTTENPWLRPGFLASGLVVIMIIALTIYIGLSSGHDHSPAAGSPSANTATAGDSVSPRTTRSNSPDASICGMPAAARPGALDAAALRSTSWRYSSNTAYPTSSAYGPGATSPHGFRYCFQHSIGGALFAAANSLAFDNADAAQAAAWSDYILADGPYRQAELDGDYVPNDPDTRLQIIGYRVLSYSDHEARVDIAVQTSTPDDIMIISCVTHLVWQRGDWRFSTATAQPTSVARIPDATGYTPWSAA